MHTETSAPNFTQPFPYKSPSQTTNHPTGILRCLPAEFAAYPKENLYGVHLWQQCGINHQYLVHLSSVKARLYRFYHSFEYRPKASKWSAGSFEYSSLAHQGTKSNSTPIDFISIKRNSDIAITQYSVIGDSHKSDKLGPSFPYRVEALPWIHLLISCVHVCPVSDGAKF
jgi:hypothetical protein